MTASIPSEVYPWWLKLSVGVLLLCGVFLRFYHVDHKAFWDDEVVTWLHIHGLYEGEVVTQAAHFHSVADLQAVLHPATDGRPLSSVVGPLRDEDPQHPPLYYQIGHLWISWFGDSVKAVRTLSAIFGVLAIPCMFWLCFELFGSASPGWAGAVLVATSPIDVIYSQEAREYSLWLLCMLLSSALFLRAMRFGTLRSWSAYSLALAVGLYVFPLTAFVAAAHGIVVLGAHQSMRKTLRALGAMALGGLLFIPWLRVIASKLADINASMPNIVAATSSRMGTLWRTITLIRLEVVDFDGAYRLVVLGATVPIVALLLLAIYDVRRQASRVSKLLVWALLGSIAVPLIGLDLVLGGHRVETARYFTPMFLALDLCLAAFIARQFSVTVRPRSRAVWTLVLLLVFAFRISSSAMSSEASTWWNSYHMRSHEIAAQIDESRHPVIVSDDYVLWPLVLSEYLDPNTTVALRPRCYQCKNPRDDASPLAAVPVNGEPSTLFMIAPSATLQSAVRARASEQPSLMTVHCIDVQGSCPAGISFWSSAK